MPDASLAPYAVGGLTGLAGILAGWFQSRRKADVDESANVLTAWKNLMESTEQRVSSLVAEVEGLRKRLSLAEGRIGDLEGQLSNERQARREVEDDLAKERKRSEGLARQIAQNSQSTAVMLQPNTAVDDDAAKLGRAGDNIRKAGK